MDNFFLRPARDAAGKAKRVPDEFGGVLPAAGAFKPRTQYWLRRLADADVTLGELKPDKKSLPARKIEPPAAKPSSARPAAPPAGTA
jgi:hypothetical protein